MKVSIIVATSVKDVIGNEGDIPWTIPSDLKRFSKTTSGHILVVGRNTFDSIGKCLPNRETYVITSSPDKYIKLGASVHTDIDDLMVMLKENFDAGDERTIYIAGGAGIYKACEPYATEIIQTFVHADIEGDTKYTPDISFQFWDHVHVNHEQGESDEYATSTRTSTKPADADDFVVLTNTVLLNRADTLIEQLAHPCASIDHHFYNYPKNVTNREMYMTLDIKALTLKGMRLTTNVDRLHKMNVLKNRRIEELEKALAEVNSSFNDRLNVIEKMVADTKAEVVSIEVKSELDELLTIVDDMYIPTIKLIFDMNGNKKVEIQKTFVHYGSTDDTLITIQNLTDVDIDIVHNKLKDMYLSTFSIPDGNLEDLPFDEIIQMASLELFNVKTTILHDAFQSKGLIDAFDIVDYIFLESGVTESFLERVRDLPQDSINKLHNLSLDILNQSRTA